MTSKITMVRIFKGPFDEKVIFDIPSFKWSINYGRLQENEAFNHLILLFQIIILNDYCY